MIMNRLKAWFEKIGREAIVRESRAETIILEAKVDLILGWVEDLEEQIGYLKSQINYIISLFPEGTALGKGYEKED